MSRAHIPLRPAGRLPSYDTNSSSFSKAPCGTTDFQASSSMPKNRRPSNRKLPLVSSLADNLEGSMQVQPPMLFWAAAAILKAQE